MSDVPRKINLNADDPDAPTAVHGKLAGEAIRLLRRMTDYERAQVRAWLEPEPEAQPTEQDRAAALNEALRSGTTAAVARALESEVGHRAQDWMLNSLIERRDEWRRWLREIPPLRFPGTWLVQVTPPIMGAIVRFRVEPNISVYLDCYSRLGFCQRPYWEAYDGSDTERFIMGSTEPGDGESALLAWIEEHRGKPAEAPRSADSDFDNPPATQDPRVTS